MLTQLNQRFSRGEFVQFSAGQAGFPRAVLRNGSGSEVEVYLYGATVTSWRGEDRSPVLFESSRVVFQEGKAIRGGIPIVFPQFGPGVLPSHGFARTQTWGVVETEGHPDQARIVLGLSSNDQTRKVWAHEFELICTIVLSKSLLTTLEVRNTGAAHLDFENAFHTYFTVSDLINITVPGLKGLTYLDNTKKREAVIEPESELQISSEVDRVYTDAPDTISIKDKGSNRRIMIRKSNLSDAVVWNPWVEKSKALSDLGPEDFHRFICVETGNVAIKKTLRPGGRFACEQELSLGKL